MTDDPMPGHTIEITSIERRSNVLTPSGLPCLKTVPTINLTAGCAHRCVYCYARGYRTHPGDRRVEVYSNLYDKLADELPRKRKKPVAVSFSPSSDMFQPIDEVLDMAYRIIELLFSHGVGVAFLTRGRIPDEHLELLLSRPELVRAQIGLLTNDEKLLAQIEPGAASAEQRVEQGRRLIAGGVHAQFRLDPIMPNVTDSDEQFDALLKAISKTGCRRIAASVMFLRPAVTGALKRNVKDSELLARILRPFQRTVRVQLEGTGSATFALPLEQRRAIHQRLQTIATQYGLSVHLCGCKNPDVTSQVCHISGQWGNSEAKPRQQLLFDSDE